MSPKAAPTTRAGHGLRPADAPEWLPPYTAAQQALLLDGAETPVQVPVSRVFPDLTRFRYAANHRMDDPTESLTFTKLVATVVTESPHFYVITEAPPGVENAVVQYGPRAGIEPDAWATVERGGDGSARLVKAPMSDGARADYDRAGVGDKAGRIEALKAAVAKSPAVPALRVALAEALAGSGDADGAEGAYKGALSVDPTLATAHVGLAEIHEKRGERTKARRAVVEALAYHPGSKRAATIAQRLALPKVSAARVQPYRVFLDVTGMGAVRVAASGGTPGQMYGSCRAVMRYEPDVRAAIFEQPEATPYYLSVIEEIVCLEAAIGAYLFERHSPKEGEGAPPDAAVEDLLELAQTEGLLGYAMFEILGQHRPERARTAPPEVHRAVVNYVSKHVIGEKEELPDGIYNAMATPGSAGRGRSIALESLNDR